MESNNNPNTHRAFGISAPAPIIEEQPTTQVLIERQLQEQRDQARADRIESHGRQADAHAERIADLVAAGFRYHLANPLGVGVYARIEAHAHAAKLHVTAAYTDHRADADRAWNATMVVAELDGEC